MDDRKTNVQDNAEIMEQNPELFSALRAAILEHPVAEGLSETDVVDICADSIRLNAFNDSAWLESRLKEKKALMQLNPQPGKASGEQNQLQISAPIQPSTQDELDEIFEKHQAWIASVLHPSKAINADRANLKGADLTAFNFDGADLRAANLEGTNLSGVSLKKANLSAANLKNADLSNADLSEANLKRANLSGALTQDCDFTGAKLDRIEGLDVSSIAQKSAASELENEAPGCEL
jgi:hypothetical protein